MKKRRNESVTPYIPYGPATGVPTPEPKNEVLGSDRYDGDSTPGMEAVATDKGKEAGCRITGTVL